MFHPVKKEVSNKTIRLPDTLLEKMELLAVQKDVSFYQIVVQCCEYAIFHSVSQEGYTCGLIALRLSD